MFNRLRPPSPTAVIACLALFFAIAGGSAIALQGRNSVDSGDIKKSAVKTSDLANNSVTTKKIKANHVRAADIQNNAVSTGEIRNAQVRRADLAPDEAFHRVGTPNEPQFGNGGQGDCLWSEVVAPPPAGDPFMEPAFFMDHHGVVRLTGGVMQTNGFGGDGNCDETEDSFVFTLPPAYRPQEIMVFPSGITDTAVVVNGRQTVMSPGLALPPGMVAVSGSTPPLTAILDGVSFRASGPGTGVPRRDGTVRLSAAQAALIGLD